MPLSITGFDANGRIYPKGTDVVIPPENAGIGDLIYRKSDGSFKICGRGTASDASPSSSSPLYGYTLYGIIYGFVNGEAMICAPTDSGTMTWGAYNPSTMEPYIYGGGTVLMRNGIKCTYALMNLATSMNDDWRRGTAGTNVHPTAIYNGGVMTKATFEGTSGAEARKIYGTWEEYLLQTLRVQGVPGSPFGAVASGVKVHEFGRWFGKTFAGTQATGTALRTCYEYQGALGTDAKGTWWLPSMFELGELMIDEHYNLVEENVGKAGITTLNRLNSNRWSCVLNSSTDAWIYNYDGFSDAYVFSVTFAVRPVSLFKLR